jgi:hypothetical protein
LVYDGARAYAVLSFWSDPATDADRAAFFESLRVNAGASSTCPRRGSRNG